MHGLTSRLPYARAAVSFLCISIITSSVSLAQELAVDLAPLAGFYTHPTGGEVLRIEANGSIQYRVTGCGGTIMHQVSGKACARKGYLALDYETPKGGNERGRKFRRTMEFLPVEWGRRIFLVEERDILEFDKYLIVDKLSSEELSMLFLAKGIVANAKATPSLQADRISLIRRRVQMGTILDASVDHGIRASPGSKDGVQIGADAYMHRYDNSKSIEFIRFAVKSIDADSCVLELPDTVSGSLDVRNGATIYFFAN